MRLRLLLASSVGLAAAIAVASPALGGFTYSRTGGGIVTVAAGSLPPTGSLDTLYRVTGQTNGTDCDNTPSGSAVAYCAWNGAAYAAVGVAASGLTNPLVIDLDAAGNDIVNVATVDGRDVSVDGAKLDGIAAGATVGLGADPSPCPAGQYASDQNQSGVLVCSVPAGGITPEDKAKLDGFAEPYSKIVRITDRETACATYTAAFEEYHDGTAAEGQYRVKVTFNLTGAEALRPNVDFYDDGGNWPYKACFVHHPALPGSFNGSFPDSKGRLTANAGTVNHTGGIEVYVDLDGTIEIDKTGLSKNALLWDTGSTYLAGCDEGAVNDDICGDLHFGTMTGALRMRGNVAVEIVTKADGTWTGEGTPSMGPNARLSKEAASFFAIFAAHGNTYADLSELTINAYRLGHTDVIYHQVNSWGIQPPKLQCVTCEFGIGAMFYGFANFTGAGRDWSLKNMDHALLLGDADNGGKTVVHSACDALDKPNGTCGTSPSGVALGSVTTGVVIDGVMAEGGSQSYSTLAVPTIGQFNKITGLYAEQTTDFTGVSVALGPQYCDGVSGSGTRKPKGTIVANDADCSTAGGGVASTAPDAATPGLRSWIEIGFAHSPSAVVAPAKTILLGDACVTNRHVVISGHGPLFADSAGNEFQIANAIATAGGCDLTIGMEPETAPLPSYYKLAENWIAEKYPDPVYRCEAYPGADIGARCNAAYAAALANNARGAIIDSGRGHFVQTTKFDACDETGAGQWIPFTLRGVGVSISATNDGTRWLAGSGLATSNVARTSFTVTADVDALGRDRIGCVGCDFLAAGIRRGDLIETSAFASSSNNYIRTNSAGGQTRRGPMKVYSVTPTALILEGEINPGPNMVTTGAVTDGQVRKLSTQIELCHSNQYVEDIELDGDSTNTYADVGIHRSFDNVTTDGCTGAGAPWPGCTGLGTGSIGIRNSIGGGERGISAKFHRYYNVAVTAPATGGQNDHYFVEKSHLAGSTVNFWMDDEQAEPGPVLRDTQLEAYTRNGVRIAAGNVYLDHATVVSREAGCTSDAHGECKAVELLAESTTGLTIESSSIEAWDQDGIGVGAQSSAPRQVAIRDSVINGLGSTTKLFDGANFCGTFTNEGNIWANWTSSATPLLLSADNANPATCPLRVQGVSSYFSFTPTAPPPKLVVGRQVLTPGDPDPAVDTRTILAPFYADGDYEEDWFAIDGAKSLCVNQFNSPAGGAAPQTSGTPPDEWCDSGGSIRAGKTKVVGEHRTLVNLTETEAYGEFMTLLCGGDSDCVGDNMDVFAIGGAKARGDEGASNLRAGMFDHYFSAEGSVVGTVGAGGGLALISISGITRDESMTLGEGKLLVFSNSTGAGRLAQNVELTSVPNGTLDNGTLNGGTTPALGNAVWGIAPGLIASQGFGPGWCLTPTDAAFADYNNVTTRPWFKIVAANAGANTVETEFIAQGENYGVAFQTLAETGANEARLAPCVEIATPLFNVGADRIADQLIVRRDAAFPGTAASPTFEVGDYPTFRMQSTNLVVGRQHGSQEGHYGHRAEMYIDGVRGRFAGIAAFEADVAGDLSLLVDGRNHGWESGFRVRPGAAESGFRYDYRDVNVGQQFGMLDFGNTEYAADRTFNVLRLVEAYEQSLAFKPSLGFGQGIGTFEPFLRASVTDDSINGGVPNGAGAKVHWSQILGVPTDIVDGDDVVAGEAGDSVSINGSAVDSASGVNFRDSASIVLSHGGGADPETVEARLNYGLLQTGNPTLNAKECVFSTFGTSGGGIMCEGSTANDLEQLYKFPVLDSLDSEFFFVVTNAPITDPLSAAVAFSSFQIINGNLTDLSDGLLTGSKVEVFTPSVGGAVPASGGGTANFLRADGAWAAPPGGGGGGTTVQVDGVAAPSPVDIQSAGDIDSILCTSAGVPDASCEALGDVIFRAKADSVALGTDTTGNYAASASEAGPALLAVALVGNGGNCAPGTYPLGVDTFGAVETCTTDDDVPDAGDFGAATDLDASGAVEPDSVALGTDTTGNYAGSASEAGPATTALALSTNALNCGAGLFAKGVDAAGVAEGCEDVVVPAEVSAYTTGTSTPVDGSTACNTGDMHLETDRRVTFYCVDGATDDWWGVQLLDDVP